MYSVLGFIALVVVFPFAMQLLALLLSNPLLIVVAVPAGLFVAFN
jgi:hypothetical protein